MQRRVQRSLSDICPSHSPVDGCSGGPVRQAPTWQALLTAPLPCARQPAGSRTSPPATGAPWPLRPLPERPPTGPPQQFGVPQPLQLHLLCVHPGRHNKGPQASCSEDGAGSGTSSSKRMRLRNGAEPTGMNADARGGQEEVSKSQQITACELATPQSAESCRAEIQGTGQQEKRRCARHSACTLARCSLP